MPYAVLQTDLRVPTIEQLQRAARHVPGLTGMDASILGADAFGILVKNFSGPQAAALQGALRVEGVETEIVDQSDLPPLPPGKLVNRLECRPEHLLVYDPIGRTFPVEWPHVAAIAAGAVRVTEFVRERRETLQARHAAEYRLQPTVNYDSREEQSLRWLAEIILTGGVMRFSVSAERFNFSYLGERRASEVARNFTLLVQDLMQFSPHARCGRGAESIQRGEMFLYPSKNAFHEEIVWMLWQNKKAG